MIQFRQKSLIGVDAPAAASASQARLGTPAGRRQRLDEIAAQIAFLIDKGRSKDAAALGREAKQIRQGVQA